MSENNSSEENTQEQEEKPFYKIIWHSFFVIPFLIAVFCILLFAGMHLLTRENRSAYDYLEDVKVGGHPKRWQGAFELSNLLSNPKLVPTEERFSNELINAFKAAKNDDNRVRQYLALAMGRTGKKEFVEPLISELQEAKDENVPAMLYALGMIGDKAAVASIKKFLNHSDARVRSIAVVSLGQIGDPDSLEILKPLLKDSEPNVQWGAAISLGKMGDASGKSVIADLLDRNYLAKFPEVDPQEQTQLVLSAIEVASLLNSSDLNEIVKKLSTDDPNANVRTLAYETINR